MNSAKLKISSDGFKTREELVTDAIREAILNGRFRPGDKLDQTELAEELNVSRSPVREALRTLAAEELITHVPHRGAVVTVRSIAELEQLLFIRSLLEGAAAKRAITHMTDERLQQLSQIIDEGIETTDMERALALNNLFHTTIYETIDQPLVVDLIQSLRNKVAPYNRLYLDLEGKKDQAWNAHKRIFIACEARDGDMAEQETKQHLEQVFKDILASLTNK
jgi:DNA-binding GntR family transcriptional regulator